MFGFRVRVRTSVKNDEDAEWKIWKAPLFQKGVLYLHMHIHCIIDMPVTT